MRDAVDVDADLMGGALRALQTHQSRVPQSETSTEIGQGEVTHGSLPRCSLGVSRESNAMSASTMMRTNSWKRTLGSQPRASRAFDASPTNISTSAGRS